MKHACTKFDSMVLASVQLFDGWLKMLFTILFPGICSFITWDKYAHNSGAYNVGKEQTRRTNSLCVPSATLDGPGNHKHCLLVQLAKYKHLCRWPLYTMCIIWPFYLFIYLFFGFFFSTGPYIESVGLDSWIQRPLCLHQLSICCRKWWVHHCNDTPPKSQCVIPWNGLQMNIYATFLGKPCLCNLLVDVPFWDLGLWKIYALGVSE